MDVSLNLLHPTTSLRQRAIRRRVRRTADSLVLQSGPRPIEGLARQVAEALEANAVVLAGRIRATESQRIHDTYGLPSDSLVSAEISLPDWQPRPYSAEELKRATAGSAGEAGSPVERLLKLCERHRTVLGHGFAVQPLEPLSQDLPFPALIDPAAAQPSSPGGLLIVAWDERGAAPRAMSRWVGSFAELAARAFRAAAAQRERSSRQIASAAVHRIGLAIAAGQPLETILRDVCRTSVDLLEARGAAIRIGRGDRLALEAVAGAVLPHRSTDAVMPASDQPGPSGERSLLALPLRLDGPLEGSLVLHWRRPRALELYEWETLERLVDLASKAVGELGVGAGTNGASAPVRPARVMQTRG